MNVKRFLRNNIRISIDVNAQSKVILFHWIVNSDIIAIDLIWTRFAFRNSYFIEYVWQLIARRYSIYHVTPIDRLRTVEPRRDLCNKLTVLSNRSTLLFAPLHFARLSRVCAGRGHNWPAVAMEKATTTHAQQQVRKFTFQNRKIHLKSGSRP